MDAFFESLPLTLLRIIIVLFVLLLITGTGRRMVMGKTIKAILGLPYEKKEKLIRVYEQSISAWKILLWMAPLSLIVVPTIIYFVLPNYFRLVITLMVGTNIMLIDDFLYKKLLLRSIGSGLEH